MTKLKKQENSIDNELINRFISLSVTIRLLLFALLKEIYILIFIGLFVILIYRWNFDKADMFFDFLKTSFWPLIVLFAIFLFKNEISSLISKGIVIILPGGHQLRLNEPAPQQETIQKNPEPKIIEDYKEKEKLHLVKIEALGKSYVALKTQLINTQIYLDFERNYRVVFGSQVDLLKRLRSIFPTGQAGKDIIFTFISTQRLFPVFASWTFTQYMNFLLTSNLINFSNDNYFITDKGKAFLAYIEILNYPQKGL
ncbi:hypothetical protein A3F03_01965 [Candidatus Roizmanbacteria bacterium RIFCSPHIGHO2_12_FULL_41_11]|uniref:Uncharacterized protein n=3 Tax=Candidatus Roizmaniibacteriota TaxID=1752723 RepID=A0A1F7J6X1_9BACT|nr:MAG: hypothetical protein A3F03_01965 [Candidatus Roizmanbacteria bacterium RIFCSPHIGHO2_12_FULL_41_11]OGK51352.1 MAG: hypothetical protein A2966_04500 [Candidatus Roizmanbacteria bacterium RIFCSPLOWO2_01_FULL_41_22]